MKVGLINAYSASNRGDGLLVEIALQLIDEAFPGAEVVVAAHDPVSFDYLNRGVVAPLGRNGKFEESLRGLLALASAGRFGFEPAAMAELNTCDVVVSVGGAYLRGGHLSEFLKCSLVHVSQLRWAAKIRRKRNVGWVMLPQSVGPFNKAARPLLSRVLSAADHVYLRDDRSFEEFTTLAAARRVSDCAVLQVAAGQTRGRAHGDGTALVLRGLRSAPNFQNEISRLLSLRSDWIPVLQASRRGNNDSRFYEAVGVSASASLLEVAPRAAACVSVRLHGALESILLGVPAIHLAYERKGLSAFSDLGLEEYVFDARNFDANEVASTVQSLRENPTAYWSSVEASLAPLIDQRGRIVSDISKVPAQRHLFSGSDGRIRTSGGRGV